MGLILTGLLAEKYPCITVRNMAIIHRSDSGTIVTIPVGDDAFALEAGTVQIFVDNDDGSEQARRAFLGLIGSQSYGGKATPKAAARKTTRPR